MYKPYLPSIKVTILGESSTGKTAIVYRLVNNIFKKNIESTIGASFMTFIIDDIKLEIWDTAGQDRYLALVPMYYRNADVILMVFDLSKIETIERLLYYLEKISADLSNYRIIIIGNKMDLINHDNLPSIDKQLKNKLEKYKYLFNVIDFINISTKTGENFSLFNDKLKFVSKTQSEKKLNTSQNIITLHETSIDKSISLVTTITSTLKDSIIDKSTNAYEYCSC